MEVNIQRIDTSLPLPEYKTEGAVCFDLPTRETTVIPPRSVVLVPTNIVVEVPTGFFLMVTSRSSTAPKKGLFITLGIIDEDYCGPDDEIFLQVWNPSNEPITVERGERIGQAGFVYIDRLQFNETTMTAKSRGGFGTTG